MESTLCQVYNRQNKIILHGDRTDVLDKIACLSEVYVASDDQRRKDRIHAIWAFEHQWDKDHPYPPDLVGAYIAQLREEAANE